MGPETVRQRSLLVPGLLLFALALTTAGVSVGAYLFGRVEYRRVTSPDGDFVAVTSSRRYQGFVPRGPGSGSDKPGFLEVRRVSDGRSCGEVELPLLWLGNDLRWELESRPRSAVLVGAATWYLEACTVDTSGW